MLRHYVRVSETFKKFAADLSGVTAIEYGLIAAGIAVAIILAVGLVGDNLDLMFNKVATEVAPPAS
jgi:pilus assembly protein Flp/PilA